MKRALLFLVLIAAQAPAQPGPPKREEPDEGQILYVEVLQLPSAGGGPIRVDVLIRLDRSFFVPVSGNEPGAPLMQRGELLVEFFAKGGISRARDIRRMESASLPAPAPDAPPLWHEEAFSFLLEEGQYEMLLEADDLESGRRHTERKPLEIGNPAPPVAASFTEGGGSHPRPGNFGGDVRYGEGGGLLLVLPAEILPESVQVRFSVAGTGRPGLPERVILRDSLWLDKGTALQGGAPRGRGDALLWVSSDERRDLTFLHMDLPLEKLPLRTLTLVADITTRDSVIRLTKEFRTVWPGMPRSLRNPGEALDALRFITREEELDSLKRGSPELRRERLEAFWRDKDPTPRTPYNENMAEYYRRIDHARREFTTIRVRDGLRTARARVYVLHGPPSRVERNLLPSSGYRETWTYDNLQRRFTFGEGDRQGEYELLGTEDF
ncbi:MAG: GWxTD domain-containing protein [Bacteroidota bacterium]